MRDLLTAQLALTVLEADYETEHPGDDPVTDEGSDPLGSERLIRGK
jgi:hypothetical protein